MSDQTPLALQLYTLRDQLGVDFEATVRRVAAMGYVGVEPFGGMPGGLPESAALFRELELEVPSCHVPFPDEANRAAVLDIVEAYGLQRVCIAMLPPAEFDSIDGIKSVCEKLNQAGAFASSQGFELGYHNHWWEFKQLDGRPTLDLMLEELDESVFLEIDTYWVQVGGLDPVDVLRQVGARAPLIHLKDGPIGIKDNMNAIGQGKIDVPAVVAAAAPAAEWHIVEQDRSASDMLQEVQDSYTYLTSQGFARGKV